MRNPRAPILRLLLLAAILLAVASAAEAKTYVVTLDVVVSNTGRTGTYTGVLEVDISSLTGLGTETRPFPSFRLDYPLVGDQSCPVGGTATFVNGVLVQISSLCSDAWGFNTGFGCDLPEPEVACTRNWFGSLDAGTFVDGFGTYTVREAYGVALPGVTAASGKLSCQNKTTKQKVKVTIQPGQTEWNCEDAGLEVGPDDEIVMSVKLSGDAD